MHINYFPSLSSAKKNNMKIIRVSNSLDPDQARRFVGPGLGPKLLAKVIIRSYQQTTLVGEV